MTDAPIKVAADSEKLREVLAERGLPLKLSANLNYTERKVHDLLCTAYDFATNRVALEIPQQTFRKCGVELQKIWDIQIAGRSLQGKQEIIFHLKPEAIRMTLRTHCPRERLCHLQAEAESGALARELDAVSQAQS